MTARVQLKKKKTLVVNLKGPVAKDELIGRKLAVVK
jgi:hypothetical protein